jgi:peptidoglycan/xylan/chitin deacetylase (PgdA/CDA1 family)
MYINLKKSLFIISLDFEKMWGVFDKRTIHTYGGNVAYVELIIDRLLALFEKYDIHCTWATVGMLFHPDLESCKNKFPIVLPHYANSKLSSYMHLKEISSNDFGIYYSGISSIYKISSVPNQEIATHTYSHFYCLEDGSSVEAFSKDLEMAINISKENGFETNSIVFPRNQYNETFLENCSKMGIKTYRGTESSWVQRSRNQNELMSIHRIIRFIDSYINITGSNIYKQLEINDQELVNIPASFFLRPFNPKLSYFEAFKIRRIKNSMLRAAREGSLFHLWWHPHNFGANTEQNFCQLESILIYYTKLKNEYGMRSRTMNEVANEYFSCEK